jgi:hypothetical protein
MRGGNAVAAACGRGARERGEAPGRRVGLFGALLQSPRMFSGGSYDEVKRWLRMFLNSHAKREDPRVEAVLDNGDAREGRSYGAWLRRGSHSSALMEFDYQEVAQHRGELAWCAALAQRVRQQARQLLASSTTADVRTR